MRASKRAATLAALCALTVAACSSGDDDTDVSVADRDATTSGDSRRGDDTAGPDPIDSTTPSTSSTTTSTLAPEPVWVDEFDGPGGSPVDSTRWTHDEGGTGWGNQQLEYYSPANASLDGSGNLDIVARPVDVTTSPPCWYGNCHFTSSRLTTAGLAAFTYGTFEMRAKFPAGEATWPAFWLLGANTGEVGWPTAGEIDVVENVGRDGDVIRGTVHGPGYSGGNGIAATADIDDITEFHTYTVRWEPDRIIWSVDGDEYHRVERSQVDDWVFDHDFHLIVNLAVGGTLAGSPGPSDYRDNVLTVDYIKVWSL